MQRSTWCATAPARAPLPLIAEECMLDKKCAMQARGRPAREKGACLCSVSSPCWGRP